MRFGKVEHNYNKKLRSAYRTGMVLFLAGTATGVCTTIHFMKKDRKEMLDTISVQESTIKKLNSDSKKRRDELEDLKERNEELYDQNRKLWLEHRALKKRKHISDNTKEPMSYERANKADRIVTSRVDTRNGTIERKDSTTIIPKPGLLKRLFH